MSREQPISLQKAISTTSNLTWSPDGEKIAFYEGEAIYVIKDDDKGRWDVINRIDNAQPQHSWSPDGKRIAFVDQSVSDLYVINADGSGRRHLAKGVPSPSGSWASFPAWSPDGKKLAFFCPTPPGSERTHLCVINADGTSWKRLALDVDQH